jgi:hypothetical protein
MILTSEPEADLRDTRGGRRHLEPRRHPHRLLTTEEDARFTRIGGLLTSASGGVLGQSYAGVGYVMHANA